MKKIFLATAIFMVFSSCAFAAPAAKLPFAAGERFIVSTAYNTPPTHIKKDSYAIDFTQNGCDAYGKYAVAAMTGAVTFASESGYNGGYGTEVLVRDVRGVTERYAHMIPGSVPIAVGDAIPQGTIIGEIGNTGLVAGAACATHPGTHIHFAMYTTQADGTFVAFDPEPISGYANIKVENWYASDNALAATKGNLAALVEILDGLLNNNTAVITSSSSQIGASIVSKIATGTADGIKTPIISSGAPVSVVVVPPAVSSSAPSNASTAQQISSQSVMTSTSKATPSSTPQLFFGGGGGSGPSGGGVSVAPATITTVLSTSASSSDSGDDPSDDSVLVCE